VQKPHVEIRLEVTEKPSQWRGSRIDRQVRVSEKITLLLQLLGAGREKCVESEWSELTKSCSKHRKSPIIWRNAKKPHAAGAAFAQAL
jgi:hypothetical protein